MKITVVLPAFNEEQDLPDLLIKIRESLDSQADYQVLVVDDGSKDRTADIVRNAASSMPIALIKHPENKGLGAAIRTGLKAAAALQGTVVTLDADNSQDPALIPEMVRRVNAGADVVIASRYQPGAAEIGVPVHRLMLSRVASGTIRKIVRYEGATDFTCGFRAYRLKTLQTLLKIYGNNLIRENGFSCMLEILLNFKRTNARVEEVPLILRYDLKKGSSKMRILRTAQRYFVTLYRAYQPLTSAPEETWEKPLRDALVSELTSQHKKTKIHATKTRSAEAPLSAG